jgi:hypothetical protein
MDDDDSDFDGHFATAIVGVPFSRHDLEKLRGGARSFVHSKDALTWMRAAGDLRFIATIDEMWEEICAWRDYHDGYLWIPSESEASIAETAQHERFDLVCKFRARNEAREKGDVAG